MGLPSSTISTGASLAVSSTALSSLPLCFTVWVKFAPASGAASHCGTGGLLASWAKALAESSRKRKQRDMRKERAQRQKTVGGDQGGSLPTAKVTF